MFCDYIFSKAQLKAVGVGAQKDFGGGTKVLPEKATCPN